MIALFCGLGCGLLSFFLLRIFIRLLLKGDMLKTFCVLFAKMLLIVTVFILSAILWHDELWVTGAGFAGVLILCALVNFFVSFRKKDKKDA